MPGHSPRTPDAVVFLPGIMGSQLSDASGRVVWGMRPSLVLRQLALGDVLERLRLDEDASEDGITATGVLRWPANLPLLGGVEPYRDLRARLERTVEDPAALLVFHYDWRRSIEHAARRFEQATAAHLATWRRRRGDTARLTLVCHSMGGLVASYAVEVLGGLKPDVRQIITLGTPFRGSVKALRILANGDYLPFGLLAKQLRDSSRTLPGLYNLIARYSVMSDGDQHRRIASSDITALGASGDRAESAFATLARLDDAFQAAGAAATPVRSVVGVAQPTFQSLSIDSGAASFHEHLGATDEGGDGTVMRRAASRPGAAPVYLPQSHGALAKSEEAMTFAAAVLTESALGDLQADLPSVGLRLPDAVAATEPFQISIHVEGGRPRCWIDDAESNRRIAVITLRREDERYVGSATIDAPGLYRVSASGQGLSAVRQLLPVLPRPYR